MMNNKFLWLIFLLPLLYSCPKYNKAPFDKKEETLRQFPVEKSKSMVLDSLWNKRDSLTYLRLKNLKTIMMIEVDYIPNWLSDFDSLRIFKIVNGKNKKIKIIPSNIGKLSNLVQFDIPNNEVPILPESFYDLKKMQYLKLQNNKIETIYSKIGNLENIQSLDLTGNPLKSLPNEICNIKQLKFLNFENTKITELPMCLGNLQNLDWLNVSGTQLTEFPIEILNAPKLETIDAKRLKLKNYKEVKAICECISSKESVLFLRECF